MIGTIVNVFAIILGSILGLLLKGGIPKNMRTTIMDGLALCVIFIGISGSLKAQNTLLIIISMVIGSIIGELIDIDDRLKKFGDFIEAKFKGRLGAISDGFVASSLLFCVGAMAIVGSLESGLKGDYKILFAKSMLDCVSAIVFASSFGIGVIFSSLTVGIYQGAITIAAFYLKSILTTQVINDMTAVGSLLIIGLGLNMLKVTKIKIANLLPAVFIPMIYQVLMTACKH